MTRQTHPAAELDVQPGHGTWQAASKLHDELEAAARAQCGNVASFDEHPAEYALSNASGWLLESGPRAVANARGWLREAAVVLDQVARGEHRRFAS